AVQPGGCSGLIYQLYFDERLMDGDLTAEFDGVEVIVDKMSDPYLSGAVVDFADTIEKQGFTIDNPHAQAPCACGDPSGRSRAARHPARPVGRACRAGYGRAPHHGPVTTGRTPLT